MGYAPTSGQRGPLRRSPLTQKSNQEETIPVIANYGNAYNVCSLMFVSSGSEANEIAMKVAHLYWAAQGRDDKHRFVSGSVSYHGSTAGALSASGQPRYAAPYRPLVSAGGDAHRPAGLPAARASGQHRGRRVRGTAPRGVRPA